MPPIRTAASTFSTMDWIAGWGEEYLPSDAQIEASKIWMDLMSRKLAARMRKREKDPNFHKNARKKYNEWKKQMDERYAARMAEKQKDPNYLHNAYTNFHELQYEMAMRMDHNIAFRQANRKYFDAKRMEILRKMEREVEQLEAEVAEPHDTPESRKAAHKAFLVEQDKIAQKMADVICNARFTSDAACPTDNKIVEIDEQGCGGTVRASIEDAEH